VITEYALNILPSKGQYIMSNSPFSENLAEEAEGRCDEGANGVSLETVADWTFRTIAATAACFAIYAHYNRKPPQIQVNLIHLKNPDAPTP
jgi:hypothetical protein